MKLAVFFLALSAIAVSSGCSRMGMPKKPKQYTVDVLRDELPVDGAVVRLVVWRKTEVPGAPMNPSDVIYETRSDSSGKAEIPVKRKSSFGIKATACLDDVVWAGDAWVSRKSQRVQIDLEQTEASCTGE